MCIYLCVRVCVTNRVSLLHALRYKMTAGGSLLPSLSPPPSPWTPDNLLFCLLYNLKFESVDMSMETKNRKINHQINRTKLPDIELDHKIKILQINY